MSKWENILLEKLCNFEKGNTGLAKAIEGIYPLITTSSERKTCNTYQFDTKAVCIPLVSSTGHGHASINNIHYQEGKFALGTILVALIPKDENILNSKFLHLYLSRLKDIILVPLMTGAANVSLSVSKIKNVKIPLPPINEQIKIVKKFESIVDEQKELDYEIENQQNLLTKLKQSILQEAIEGKLTAKWREQNQDIEPASVLLKKIQVEKEQLIKEKKIKKTENLPKILKDEELFNKPFNWTFCYIQDLYSVMGGKRVPKEDSLLDTPTKNIYIRVLNMQNDTIEKRDLKYISDNTFEKIKNYTISSNDLYITVAGTIGRVGTVPNYFNNMSLTENANKLCPINEKFIDNKYILYCLKSKYIQNQLLEKVYGMAMPKLAIKRIENTILPLPPFEEQKEIVNKIEKLFAICDELEEQINNSKQNTQILMQAVLKEAFEK